MGRLPVLAFTSSRHLVEQFNDPPLPMLKDARDYLMLYQLSSREEYVLHPIGLPRKDCKGFQLHTQRFTTTFANRLQALLRPLREAVQAWRRELDGRGRIAWPLRASGILKDEDRDKLFAAYRYLLIERDAPASAAALDEKTGIDVQEILDTLQRMKVSPQAQAAGYQDTERCGLFTTLDEHAAPQLPAFVHRLCAYLVAQGKEWSYETAQNEWFWGYTWEGARPLDTYIHWMALLCDLGYAYETSTGTRKNDKRYRLIERSAMRGSLTEASNWLADEYPQIVEKMKDVFGEGKVTDYFAPMPRPGTKTRDARQRLEDAETCLNILDIAETTWKNAQQPDDRQAKFIECSKKRLEAQRNITFVYSADGHKTLRHDDTLRMLNFENDVEPLWRRIGQASLFVDFVLEAKQRIVDRVGRLCTELHDETYGIKGFPVQVFTRSLEKITNILEGSVGTKEPEGSTQRLQYIAPGTLGHALKELRVSQAREKLEQLADEVGVRLDADGEVPLAQIKGSIVQNFHDLVKDYKQERERLDGLVGRLTALDAEIADAPDDFRYPPSLQAFRELSVRPEFIDSALSETLAEDVEELIAEHDPSSRLGNFQPLMTAAKSLLSGPKRALGQLAGQVLTLENAVDGYRQGLLHSDALRVVEGAYNALLHVQRKPQEKPLDMTDLRQAGSLKAAKAMVTERYTLWPTEGERFLEGTEVSFELWADIATDVSEGKKPTVTAQQAQGLVEKGFLEVTYRLGGGQ